MVSLAVSRTAHYTGYEPNLIQNESGKFVLSLAHGDDEDLTGSKNISARTGPHLL